MLSLQKILQARPTVSKVAVKTPLALSRSLSGADREVRLKLETIQPTGSFKIRGAMNAISNLSDAERQAGVVCASTGNHGRAIAFAAQQLGAKATICMSELVPQNKVDAIREIGADVVIVGAVRTMRNGK